MTFEELLAPGGHMREFMRTAPGGGEWVDVTCNELLLELTATHLEDLTLKYGAKRANVAMLPDGGVQLNIAWKDGNSWACHIAPTFTEAVEAMWRQYNMVQQQQQQQQQQQEELPYENET